ncbi:MAG: DUF1513 domain-containing protein [Rhodospirillales bacterium]|nr:DUF1513 domain-containing protein [Rhodospirillales bacterium]
MQRRHFLTGSLLSLAAILFDRQAGANPNPAASDRASGWANGWLTGYGTADGTYGMALIDQTLTVQELQPTGYRLHDIIRHPAGQEICMPARRPGSHFIILNGQKSPMVVAAAAGRHFYGHGVYSTDGRYLYLTENDYAGRRGVIGIYAVAAGYKRLGEMPSGGIGPHEILLHGDGRHLIVANGGIATHPASGRAKLNLDTMVPNLALINITSGKRAAKTELARGMNNLSIRHMARTPDDDILFGLQDQYPGLDEFPLVGRWQPGSEARFLTAPAAGWQRLNGYVGSLKTDSSGSIIAAVSPKGGTAVFWQRESGAAIAQFNGPDICGVAATTVPGQFLITSGMGALTRVNAGPADIHVVARARADLRFDNHCLACLS